MEGPLCPPPDPGFRLIETFLWTPGAGVQRRAGHLARLARSAARLGIEPQGVEAALNELRGEGPLRGRLTVDGQGRAEVTAAPFAPLPEGTVWRVALADARLDPGDPWLGVKTTQRALYDRARAALPEGVDEVLFLNTHGEVCEGTITNVFVETDAGLVTPPLDCGVLPGVLRAEMLETGQAVEKTLTPADLATAGSIWVGNSLRGLIRARLV
jgi:4-amino-4-deoxychorismate lyase